MIDVVLLRLLKSRKDFNQLYSVIPHDGKIIDPRTSALLDDFKKYLDAYPTHEKIDLATFLPRFRAWHPNMNDEMFNGYQKTIVSALTQNVDDDQRANIVSWIADLEMVTALANLAEKHANGDLEEDAFGEVQKAMDNYKRRCNIKISGWIDIPIGDLLQDEFLDVGVLWRLHCLNTSMRRLRPGDFGIVAARPDKGKTSFFSSEITYMAPQLPEDRNVLWLNNEGPGRRIIPRNYQAALGLSLTELKERHSQGTLVDAYRQAIGGRLDKIRIVDIHGMTNGQVEMVIQDNNPGIIIYDMIDNIKGFGEESRTDRQLEAMYQWARERSVAYDCIGLASSQISADGDGLQFPTLGMLKDSKTGKQGACDFQLMIGASNDPSFTNSRFMGLPKNKLMRPDGPKDPRCEVVFDAVRSRYKDIPIGVPGYGTDPQEELT